MPYSHFHDWSFHTHCRSPKGGNHWRAVRRRQRPWRIGALVVLIAVFIGTAAVLSVRNEVHTRIMFPLQQGTITQAPTPVNVDEPAERVAAITPGVKPPATATRTPEPVAAPEVPPTSISYRRGKTYRHPDGADACVRNDRHTSAYRYAAFDIDTNQHSHANCYAYSPGTNIHVDAHRNCVADGYAHNYPNSGDDGDCHCYTDGNRHSDIRRKRTHCDGNTA